MMMLRMMRVLVGVMGLVVAMVVGAAVAAVTWASMPDEVAARLAEGTTKLRPQDWKSGGKLWVIAPACPGPRHASDEKRSGGGAEEMVKDLKEKVFPTREVHYLAVNKDGKQVRVL